MAALMTYTVQCEDETTGSVGCFVFDRLHFMSTGKFKATSPIFSSLAELFTWDRKNGTALCFGAYTPAPNEMGDGRA